MILAKIIGTVWASHKNNKLTGYRLAVVKPVDQEGNEGSGTVVTVDTLGAGVGQLVLVAQGSNAAKFIDESVPTDAVVVALVDKFEIQKEPSP